MNVFNSHAGRHDDDDITIINPSITEDNLTNSQIPRSGTANNFNYPSASDPSDYIFVHHDPLENAKKIEDVLINYVRDLKKESNSQLDCDKQLVVRLLDLIRPTYSENQQKLAGLDRIQDDIGVLHDKRFVQEREKIEELRTEVARLNKMLFTATNDTSNYEDQMKSYSIYNSLPAAAAITGYNQWTEIENDAKKLHEIVQSQRTQINEIVTLISQATSPSSSIEQSPSIASNQPINTIGRLPPTGIDQGFLSGILERLKNMNKPPPVVFPVSNPTKNESNNTTVITEHSPGTSPTESMETIVKNTFKSSINEQTPTNGNSIEPEPVIKPPIEHKIPTFDPKSPTIEQEQPVVQPEPTIKQEQPVVQPEPTIKQEQPVVQPEPVIEPPKTPPILVNPTPVSPLTPDTLRQCPVCNYNFAPECDDVEMYEHIDNCLFPAESFQQPKEYECPSCQRKYPADRENEYLQHMSDCFNNRFEQ